MQVFYLSPVPSQAFTTTLNSVRYSFNVYQAADKMCCDISINEIPVISGCRITNGTFLIPFTTYEQGNGNFLLLTKNNMLPDYREFGFTQTLIYLSKAEIQAAVAAL